MSLILNLLSILFESISVAFIINVTLRIITKERYTKNLQKVFYTAPILLFVFIINMFITFYVPSLIWIKVFIFILSTPFIFIYIYKTNLLKGFYAIVIYLVISALINIVVAIFAKILNIDPVLLISNQTYRAFTLIIIAFLELCVGLVSYAMLDVLKSGFSFNKSTAKYIFPQLITIAFCMFPTMILLMLNFFKYSALFIIINFLQLLVISVVGLYNSRNAVRHDAIETKLENTLAHNSTLIKVNDGVRGFKHDMANIIQSLLGFVALKDIKGIEKFCQTLSVGFSDINILSILSPEIVTDPAIYGIVANKILIAREKNMKLNIDINLNVANINFSKFDLSRIIGILLDNAIEAGENTGEKKLSFLMYKDYKRNIDVISISNSIKEPDIDLKKIFKKGFSTKSKKSKNSYGIGLYNLSKIIKGNKNISVKTSIDKENMIFTQIINIKSKIDNE